VPDIQSIAPTQEVRQSSRPRGMRVGQTVRLAIFLMAVLVALLSYRYLLDLPPVPDVIAANRYRSFWLVLHAGFASTALLVGWVQFGAILRQRRPKIHRLIGRIYIVSCLVGAMSGLVLAIGTSAGRIAGVGFGSLAVLWIATNLLGLQRALAGRFVSHRRWMIRSWALTLAAVTLRIYIPLFDIVGLPQMPSYRAISFLCWVPNLLAAEIILRHGRGSRV
jgi:uncharacterized membrane protein